MSTISNSIHATHSHSASKTSASAYDRFIEKLEFSHFALISMAILIGSCLGGIASMYVFMSGAPLWHFILGLAVSMANLIACIGQAGTKTVFNLFMLSIVVNAILVISHLA